jgi:hypothetical protein
VSSITSNDSLLSTAFFSLANDDSRILDKLEMLEEIL